MENIQENFHTIDGFLRKLQMTIRFDENGMVFKKIAIKEPHWVQSFITDGVDWLDMRRPESRV
jgi:hypothetical protein